jgi:hypothetical protein
LHRVSFDRSRIPALVPKLWTDTIELAVREWILLDEIADVDHGVVRGGHVAPSLPCSDGAK